MNDCSIDHCQNVMQTGVIDITESEFAGGVHLKMFDLFGMIVLFLRGQMSLE